MTSLVDSVTSGFLKKKKEKKENCNVRCKVRRSESKWSIFPHSEQRGEKAGRGISYVQVWCVRVLSLDVGAVRGIVDKVSNLFNFLLRLVLDARGYWTLRYDTPRERSAGLGKRWIATTRVSLCVLRDEYVIDRTINRLEISPHPFHLTG